jgi:uncharacterized protein
MINKKKFFLVVAVIVSLAICFMACKKNSNNDTADFDRKAMLQNFANNIIKPAFIDLQLNVNNLKIAADAFVAAPDAAKLTTLQTTWDVAYSSWMYANVFNFGPAGEEGIRKGLVEEIGTWPANTTTIENNIIANNIALNDFNRDNRGLNAIDYLIFDINGIHTNIVTAFTNSSNRKNYLQAIVNKVKVQIDAVVTDWNGTYANTFVNKDGTDVGSSTAQLYNEFVRSFEAVKNFKVGVPLGKRVGQTNTEPTKVEARYSRNSFKYLKLNIQSIEDIWYGKSKAGADGIGWKEYLSSVTGGTDLITRTESQMQVIKSLINTLANTPSFEQQITTNNVALVGLHTELQKHIRNYKSDMSSLLGIAITFSSGDGD